MIYRLCRLIGMIRAWRVKGKARQMRMAWLREREHVCRNGVRPDWWENPRKLPDTDGKSWEVKDPIIIYGYNHYDVVTMD